MREEERREEGAWHEWEKERDRKSARGGREKERKVGGGEGRRREREHSRLLKGELCSLILNKEDFPSWEVKEGFPEQSCSLASAHPGLPA